MNYQTLLYLASLSIGMICNYHPMPFLSTTEINCWWMKVERQEQPCSFWDPGQGWHPRRYEMVSGGKLPLMGTAAALSRANERGQTVSVQAKTCKATMQGQAHAVSSCPGVPMATGSPACEYARYARVWHTVSGNLSRVQGLLLLICLLSWKKLSRCMNFDHLGAYSQGTHQPLGVLDGISDTVCLSSGEANLKLEQNGAAAVCFVLLEGWSCQAFFSKHVSVASDINAVTTVNLSFETEQQKGHQVRIWDTCGLFPDLPVLSSKLLSV